MDYYQKYLKYKHKYLNLKGGAICHKDPYHQHQGECWHDSVLAIFTYTDKLNDKVQTKLLELYNVDKDIMIQTITKYLENIIIVKKNIFAPVNFDMLNSSDVSEFTKIVIPYIMYLCIRFKEHLDIEDKYPDDTKPVRQKSELQITISLVKLLFDMYNYKSKKIVIFDEDLNKHFGTVHMSIYTIKLLSYLFLEPYQIVNTKTINILKTPEISPKQLQDTIGIYAVTHNHAVAFISCNNKKYHFNNNSGNSTMKPFDWKKIFNKQSLKDFYIISQGTYIPRYYKTYKSKKKDWNKIKDIILLYLAEYTDETYEDNYKDDDEYYNISFMMYNNILTNYEPLIVPNIISNFTKESYLYNLTFYNNFELIKKIAEADLHKVFNENINLLYYAISKKSNEDIINYLLDKNLDVNLITLDGNENVLMFSIIYDMPIDIITKIFDKTSNFALINSENKNLYDITLESKHSNKFDILRLIATKIQYTNKLNKTLIIKAIEVLNNSETILFDNLLKTIFLREDYEKSDHNRNNIFFHCVLNNKFSFIDKLKEYLRETNIELYNKLIMQTNNKRFNLLMMSVLINNPNKLLTRSVINLYTPEQLLIIKQQPYDSRTAFDIAEENNLHSDILDLLYYKS